MAVATATAITSAGIGLFQAGKGMVDANNTRKEIENFVTRKLLVPIFKGGKKVYEEPSLKEIREYCLRQTDTLWDEVKRFENPHKYYVDLSKNLWAERNGLIEKFKGIK